MNTNNNKTAVVIGGGVGGLFTSAILAKEGIKVTLVEKNTTLGGGLQSFKRFGETFDAGMHILGGIRPGGNVYRILNYLGILDRIHVRHVDDDCIDEVFFAEDGITYRMGQGKECFVSNLAEHFPEERENLKNYVDAMYRLTEEMDMFYLRPLKESFGMHSQEFLMPAGEFIAKYIKDEHLQSVLAYMNPLFGGDKYTSPAYVHSVLNVLYINGGSRLEGGCCLFVDELCRFIKENGGTIIANDGVEKIYTEDKQVTRVTTKKGLSLTADYFISAIHPCTMIGLLDDPHALPKSYRERLDSVPNTYSAFTIFLKLKPGKFRYINHMCYIMSEYGRMWKFDSTESDWPCGLMYMTTPEINQEEYSTKMIITTPMPWNMVKQWENTTVGHRTPEYEEFKRKCVARIMEMMDTRFPGFEAEYVEAVNSSSPLTIRDYYGVKEGSMYGFHKDCTNIMLSQLPVFTKLKNLYLTGQNNNLHGFCGVPLTAINTCEAIFGMNYIINKINESV